MDTTTTKGLRLQVYTTPLFKACAAGGISERVEAVTVVGIVNDVHREPKIEDLPAECRVFEPTDDAPAVWLIRRRVGHEVWHVAPLDEYDAATGKRQHWYSSGGALVGTTDSRLDRLIPGGFYGALHLHDRKEW